MDCNSISPTATVTGALSACTDTCVYSILDCNNAPAWDLYDTTQCNPEQALFGSTICEYTDIAGFPIEVRVLLTNDDRLFGEDPNARLTDPVITKAIFEPSQEQSLISVWGIAWNDTMQYIVIPRAMYTRDLRDVYRTTPQLAGKPVQPKVGDIVTTIYNNRNYEVVDIGSESVIFNAKKFVWELIVKPFRFSAQSDTHMDVMAGRFDDPFATMTLDPTGGTVTQENYVAVTQGDNAFVEIESEKIDDYRDVTDPDKASFGY